MIVGASGGLRIISSIAQAVICLNAIFYNNLILLINFMVVINTSIIIMCNFEKIKYF